MPRSEARVATRLGQRYMTLLCRHFRHKVPAEVTGDTARADFPWGAVARMAATPDHLQVTCTAGSPADLARTQDVIAIPLARFAFRDKPEIIWQPLPD